MDITPEYEKIIKLRYSFNFFFLHMALLGGRTSPSDRQFGRFLGGAPRI